MTEMTHGEAVVTFLTAAGYTPETIEKMFRDAEAELRAKAQPVHVVDETEARLADVAVAAQALVATVGEQVAPCGCCWLTTVDDRALETLVRALEPFA